MRMIAVKMFTIAAVTGLAAFPALGAEFEVKMLNKGADGKNMVFEPGALKVQPGDTIKFVAADKGHDAEAIKEMIPEGADAFKGAISKDLSVTLDKPGAYVVKCTPHFGMGMVALIVVGDQPANLAAIRDARIPKMAKDRLTAEMTDLGL